MTLKYKRNNTVGQELTIGSLGLIDHVAQLYTIDLGSTNGSIDTGIIPGPYTEVYCEFKLSTPVTGRMPVFGSGSGSGMYSYGKYNTSSYYYIEYDTVTFNSAVSVQSTPTLWQGVWMQQGGVIMIRRPDNPIRACQASNNIPVISNNFIDTLVIAGEWSIGTITTTPITITYRQFQIRQSGVLVRDFVAVPQGSTEWLSTPAPSDCLFDKVTGQYFERINNTTSTANLVPYSVNMKNIAKVAFVDYVNEFALRFTGTTTLDTGVVINNGTKVRMDILTYCERYIPRKTIIGTSKFNWTKDYNDDRVNIGDRQPGRTIIGLNPYNLKRWDTLIADESKHLLYWQITDTNDRPCTYTGSILSDETYKITVTDSVLQPSTTNALYIARFMLWSDDTLLANYVAVPQGSIEYSTTPAPADCFYDMIGGQYHELSNTPDTIIIP